MPKRKPLARAKPYDVTFKHLVEGGPAHVLKLIHLEDVQNVEVVDTEASTVVAAADKVLRVRSSKGAYLVNLEFQTGADTDLVSRLFWYNVVLHRRHDLPVWSVLLLLTRAADSPRQTGMLAITLPDGRRCHAFAYQVVRVWEMPLDALLRGGLNLLPLAPLCDEAAPKVDDVVRLMKERLDQEADRTERETLWACTYFLMGLRYDQGWIRQLIPGGREMKESVTYQATLEEGAVQEAQRILLRLGRIRFGKPDRETAAALKDIAHVEKLEQLSERLLKVGSWSELLREHLPRQKNGAKKKSNGKS